MIDVEKFIEGLHDYLAKQFAPVIDRIAQLEARPVPPEHDDHQADIGKMIADAVDKAIAPTAAGLENLAQALESVTAAPANSTDGEEVERIVSAAVQKALADVAPSDGRDALDLEILPAIDVEKSYPRGTYAQHRGGLWRSYQATAGLKGWDCIVQGVAEIGAVISDDFRTLVIKTELSGGEYREQSAHIPTVMYRGAHDVEKQYARGDGTTYGGSFWIAKVDQPQGRPGTTDDWRLAVKRGRDAPRSAGRESK
jgi:hypothetical protein